MSGLNFGLSHTLVSNHPNPLLHNLSGVHVILAVKTNTRMHIPWAFLLRYYNLYCIENVNIVIRQKNNLSIQLKLRDF